MQDAASARDEAAEEVRATLRRLSPALAREVALAAVTFTTDELAEVADDFLDGVDDFIEDADDVVESLVGDAPGAGAVNFVWDAVLLPGRIGIWFAMAVLGRGEASAESAAGADREDGRIDEEDSAEDERDA